MDSSRLPRGGQIAETIAPQISQKASKVVYVTEQLLMITEAVIVSPGGVGTCAKCGKVE